MSLLKQLQSLSKPVLSIFNTSTKDKKSLIYEDGFAIGRTQAHLQCRKGFLKLCEFDPKFRQFESLYTEDTIDLVPHQLKQHDFLDLQKSITHFVCLLTPYLEKDFVFVAFEWLVYKYEIHIQQPENVLLCCLPHHNSSIFIKFIRLLDTNKPDFLWLKTISKEGNHLTALDISSLCLKNPNVLEMICSWPMKIVDITKCDQDACKELCHVMISLGVNILNKVQLMTKEKIEKYLSPFTRFIVDGLKTSHENINSSAIILLTYFSGKISLEKNLLKSSIKRILKNGTANQFVALRSILDICYYQNYTFEPKMESLFKKNFDQLNDSEKKVIEECMEANTEKEEQIEMENNVMEIKDEMKKEPSLKKYQVLWAETKQGINIDWLNEGVESKLVDLLLKYVLNWMNFANILQLNNGSKFAMNVLKLMKEKPAELKFQYKAGGLLSHLCCCTLHPNVEVKKLSMKLLRRFSSNRLNILDFRKQLLAEDPETLFYGKVSELILTELNGLDFSSLTVSILSISIVNSKNLVLIPKFENIWNLIMSKLRFIDLSNQQNLIYRDALQKFIHRIQSSFRELGESHQQEILSALMSDLNREARNVAVEYISYLPLSLENYLFLMKDIDITDGDDKRKSIRKLNREASLLPSFYSEEVINKINIILSVFCRGQFIAINDQLVLLEQFFNVLKRIVSRLSRNTSEPVNKNLTEIAKNIMAAVLSILTCVMESKDKVNLDSISDKISLEIFSKCLYLFQDSNVNELNLIIIQNIVKLGIGSQHFNLIYFISWIGNYLVPKEDQKSMNILISIINETLPLCIKQKSQNSSDTVQIIINLIRECSILPKHRVLVLFHSIVKSLSVADKNDSILWVQMIFMTAIKPSGTHMNSNECLIMPLLKMFSPDVQILSLKKIIMFLSYFIQDPSRKRKFVDTDISSSPHNKKRKTKNADVSKIKLSANNDEENHFVSVKENLLEKKIDSFGLLKTIISYSLIHLKEDSNGLITVTESLKEFIGTLFASMKLINNAPITVAQRNEICQLFRQIIEHIGMSLSINLYLSLVIDLAIKETDESVISKCLELLASKLSIMVRTKIILQGDTELDEMAISIIPMLSDVILKRFESLDCIACLSCISSFVALGFTSKELVEKTCVNVFSNLLNINLKQISSDKVILINLFFKNFLASDKYKELLRVFKWCLNVMEKCIDNSELRNGELESSLALMYGIISRADSSSVGWECFGELLEKVFQINSLNDKLRKLAKHSCDFLKEIRNKLSKMTDTKSLISTCLMLIEKGIVSGNISYLSGSISIFGCHLINLNKLHAKYCPEEEDSRVMWKLIQLSLSLNENQSQISAIDWKSIQEISIKVLNQLCYLFEFDMEIMSKLKEFTQNSTLPVKFYLERNSSFFDFVNHHIVKSSEVDKTIEFVNNSEFISVASGFLKHLSVEIKSKVKKRKIQSTLMIPFSLDSLISEAPVQCGELIKSICNALISLLRAENKCGMNLSISDQTIDLISNICRCMLSIDQYFDKITYVTITEKHMIPLIIQIATNSFNDEALLTPLAFGLCKHITELEPIVHLAILKTLTELKTCLGCIFDSSIRENVTSFLEDCKLHDNENIADLANEI